MKKLIVTEDELIRYMEDKYGLNFEYCSLCSSLDNEYSIFVNTLAYPDSRIKVKASIKDKQLVYCDNFPSIIYTEQTIFLLRSITHKVYPDAIVRYRPSEEHFSTTEDKCLITFDKYKSTRMISGIYWYIILPQNHPTAIYREELSKLVEQCRLNRLTGYIFLNYAENEERFNYYCTTNNLSNINSGLLQGDIWLDDKFEVYNEIWFGSAIGYMTVAKGSGVKA